MTVAANPMMLRELADEDAALFPVTVDAYHRMIDEGAMVAEGDENGESGKSYELLNGVVIHKNRSAVGESPTTVGREHVFVVTRLGLLDQHLRSHGCYVRTQAPITIPEFDEPEPDGLVTVGTEADYLDHHPGPSEALCVIEVAEASLRRDRTMKLRIYAKAAIPVYFIVNLVERSVERYTQPLPDRGRYGRSETLAEDATLALPTGGNQPVEVAVRSLLP